MSGPLPSTGAFPRPVGRHFATTTIAARPERIVATADRDQLDVLWRRVSHPSCTGAAASTRRLPRRSTRRSSAAARRRRCPASSSRTLRSRPLVPTSSPRRSRSSSTTPNRGRLLNARWAASGRDDAAAAAIAETEAVLAEQATRLTALRGLDVAVAFIDVGELVMIPGNEIGGRTFTELGLTVPPTPDGLSGRSSMRTWPISSRAPTSSCRSPSTPPRRATRSRR